MDRMILTERMMMGSTGEGPAVAEHDTEGFADSQDVMSSASEPWYEPLLGANVCCSVAGIPPRLY